MKDFSHEEVTRSLQKMYDNVPFFVTYRTPDLKYIYCNNYMINYVGCRLPKEMIGKSILDFRLGCFEHLYQKQTHDAFARKIYTAIFPVCDSLGVLGLATVNKTPYFDEKNIPIGLLTQAYLVTNRKALELSNLVSKNESRDKPCVYTIGQEIGAVDLTKREKECLFYFIRGKSCKTIGKILGISFRTVETYMENIKTKFGCYMKGELVSRAIEMGYMYDIPITLFDKNFNEIFE